MVNNNAGSSDPAQDHAGEASANPVANQETEQQTIEVLLVPTDDWERLQAVQAGGTPRGVMIRISPTAPGLVGVTADGAARWGYGPHLRTALKAAVAGDDITAALTALAEKEAAEKRAEQKRTQVYEANKATVEAAGLDWYLVPSEMEYNDDYHAVVMAAKDAQDKADAKEAACNQRATERDAEVIAAGLPEGYTPWCTGKENQSPYGVQDPDAKGKQLMRYMRFRTPEDAVEVACYDAERKAKKAAEAADRETWIAEKGSPGLKDRIARGYNCQRRYMEERLNSEIPGWTLAKWDNLPDWELKDRSCPSDAAIDLEDEAKAAGFEAKTHWAVWEARYDEDHEDDEVRGEVVVVEDFHGYVIYHET